jgi:serine/threonine-protein kinase
MIGEVINNYRLSAVIGQGGMGTVYLAEHSFMGRRAAVKILRREFAEDANVIERFMNEARAANAIRHPNIIDIIDVGRMPSGIPYLMMEFLEGESLSERITRAVRMSLDAASDVALQTAAALEAAHVKGIVHRDLKPDNLYLVPDDSLPYGERVKVLDFGIAKLRGELSSSMAQTQAGALMGTPLYMSPEQCRGLSADIDHRTDIYALGIILYEMLCGVAPFNSEGWGELVLMHMTRSPPSLRAINPQVSTRVEAVVMKALAKEPGQRFQSMYEFQAALRNHS